ncbi:MAG: tRNA 2-thiouridine(34) synthase MnmA [Planctomycetota bacterium]
MSGGVDSSVAAYLLKRQGLEVVGLFMRSGVSSPGEGRARGCCSLPDARDAETVAALLEIPFYVIDLREGFEALIEEFVSEYARGRTPNPCIHCNRDLKLGALFRVAREIGANRVATGHYARVREGDLGRTQLLKGVDPDKDQSYALFALTQEQLRAALFPVGNLTKAEVRTIAREAGLPVSEKPDSQEICFVPTGDYRDLLKLRRPELLSRGEIVDVDGRVLGHHEGHALYTVGQRRGLRVAAGRPLYVVATDPRSNRVVVGERDDLLRTRMPVERVNWVSTAPPALPVSAQVKVRHRHEPTAALVTPEGDSEAEVTFEVPVTAVTPGQAAVFYDREVVLGGGWIAG